MDSGIYDDLLQNRYREEIRMSREEIKKKLQWELCRIYCDNCRHNEPDAPKDRYGDPIGCDDCHRKYMGWEPSSALLDKIIDICQAEREEE